MKGIGGFSTPTESYANRFPFLPYCWLTNNVGNMNELIKITEKDGKQVVSAIVSWTWIRQITLDEMEYAKH